MVHIFVPVSTLRQDLKNALEHFERVPAYHTALSLQNARRALENYFKDERSYFLVISNNRVSQPFADTDGTLEHA